MSLPLPEDRFIRDPDALAAYRGDEAATGELPMFVVFPESAEEVSAVLYWAHVHRVCVIPRGAGSGLSGGTTPVGDAVILSLERLNQHLVIDAPAMTATADAGVITGDIRRAAEAENLLYAPIPASVDFCTIGGNGATNAAGLCDVKYGVTREHVLSLQAVLPTGEIVHTGGAFVKNTTGYNLTQLICGSEGTLAVVTRVTLRLLPLPAERRTMLVPFESLEALSSGVVHVLEGSVPPTMEFLPKEAVDCVLGRHPEYSYPFPDETASLLIEVDGASEAEVMDGLSSIAERLARRGGGEPIVATTDQQREALWTIRKQCRDSIANSGEYIEADSVVPRHKLPELLAAAHRNAEAAGLRVISYGHAGDGNLHTYFLRGELADEDWKRASHAALKGFFTDTKDLNGTISGEHGIGLLKRDYMPLALSRHDLELMRRIKYAFDPQHILNPHKVLPDPPGVIVILDDSEERLVQMRRELSRQLATIEYVEFTNAPDLIDWLQAGLGRPLLFSLDHDLGATFDRAGQRFDPGTGRDVVHELLLSAPSCPVIIHTSNAHAGTAMEMDLADGGWQTERVWPIGVEWVSKNWIEAVKTLVS